MNYRRIKKSISLIILTVFVFTNSLYGAQDLHLRTPLSVSHERFKDAILSSVGVVFNGDDAFSRVHTRVKKEQKKVQKEMESRLANLHQDIVNHADEKIDFMGAISEDEINRLENLVDEWADIERYDHVVFVGEGDRVLSEMFLQALTKTSDWNKELGKRGRPQMHFVDSNDSTAIKTLISRRYLNPGNSSAKVKIVCLGAKQDSTAADRLTEAARKEYSGKIQIDQESQNTMTENTLALLTAGLIDKAHIREIHKGAKTAYDEWGNLNNEEATLYAAYKFAATQVRFAKTGQNVSVFTVFSKRLRRYSIWLARQFNKETGKSNLSISYSGEGATEHHHSTTQGHMQAAGFGYTKKLEEKEQEGFIAMTFLVPNERIEEGVLVHGDVNPLYKGFHVGYLLHKVDVASQTMACQQADRPIIKVDFMAQRSNDLGRMVHFGQISSFAAGKLAVAESPAQDEILYLNKAIEAKITENEEEVETLKDGIVKAEQNILNFEEGYKLSGTIGNKIQEALDRGDRKLFEFLAGKMTELVSDKSGLDKVTKALQGGRSLIHMDPEETRKAIPLAEKMGQRFKKKFRRVYVASIGGSVSPDYLVRMLGLNDGPELIFITDYDENRLRMIEEDIKNNPEEVAIIQITKSGVTPEVAVNAAAMIDTLETALREQVRNIQEDEIKEHFLFITDPKLGDLREKVEDGGYLSLDHPEHGGRWTMLSAEIGLFFYFLKGGDKEKLINAMNVWQKYIEMLVSISKNIKKYKDKLDLKNKDVSDQERISAMKAVFEEVSKAPGIWSGFLRTFITTIQQVAPELARDTEVAMAPNGSIREKVNSDKPFYQQLIVETLGKPGVRLYCIIAAGLGAIRDTWNMIVHNKRAFVTMHGETPLPGEGDTPEAIRQEAVWKAAIDELTRQGVPMMSTRTGPMSILNLVKVMQMRYLELAVSAAMYKRASVSAEGQDGVGLAKSIYQAMMVEINKGVEEEVRAYIADLKRQSPDVGDPEIQKLANKKTAELKAEGRPIADFPHDEVEKKIEIPIDLKSLMGMSAELAGIVEKIVKNPEKEKEGLVTPQVREGIESMDKNSIKTYIRTRIKELLAGEKNIKCVIIDGEEKEISGDSGRWTVRATPIENPSNLTSGTVTGTSIEIYEDGKRQGEFNILASIRVYWGSNTIRVVVSNGPKSQDFILLENDEVVEVSKSGENNFMKLAIVGDYISLGGASTGRPEGARQFEREVLLESVDFKVRREDSPTADMYLMMNKQGLMEDWMPWGEAFGLAQIIEGAGGYAMVMTKDAMRHIKGIRITKDLLKSNEQIFVYAGARNQVQQRLVWMDFLNTRSRKDKIEKAAVFDLLKVMESIPEDASIKVKANAVMLLLRLKQGLAMFPDTGLLSGQAKEMIVLLNDRIEARLTALDQYAAIDRLRGEYLRLDYKERKARKNDYALLGSPDALMRAEVLAGKETKLVYELEEIFKRSGSWDIMKDMKSGLDNSPSFDNGIKEELRKIISRLQANYKENAATRSRPESTPLPQTKSGVLFDRYLKKEVRAPKESGLSFFTERQILKHIQRTSKHIIETYLDAVKLSEEDADLQQKEILEELKAKEPQIFKDGRIESLRQIIKSTHERKAGAVVNMSGDVSSRLDFIFNSIFKYVLRHDTHAIVSEEDKAIIFGIDEKGAKGYRLVLFLDPIDGSSQIKEEGNFGSIFTMGFLKPGQTLQDGSFKARDQVLIECDLQYGPTTQLLLTNRANRQGKPEVIDFVLRKGSRGKKVFKKDLGYENLMDAEEKMDWDDGLLPVPSPDDPETAIAMAMGGSPAIYLTKEGDAEFIKWLIDTYGYEQFYTGGLVNDIRKLLVARFRHKKIIGVLHLYPKTSARPNGRFRTTFEGWAYSILFKALGGEVINGIEPLLNVKISGENPGGIKCSFFAGSTWITKLRMSWAHYLANNNIEPKQEAMQAAWGEFLDYYRQQSSRLIKEVIEYSQQPGLVPKTEKQVRRALLSWDSIDTEENYFPRFLEMASKDAYNKLFPSTTGARIDNPSKHSVKYLNGNETQRAIFRMGNIYKLAKLFKQGLEHDPEGYGYIAFEEDGPNRAARFGKPMEEAIRSIERFLRRHYGEPPEEFIDDVIITGSGVGGQMTCTIPALGLIVKYRNRELVVCDSLGSNYKRLENRLVAAIRKNPHTKALWVVGSKSGTTDETMFNFQMNLRTQIRVWSRVYLGERKGRQAAKTLLAKLFDSKPLFEKRLDDMNLTEEEAKVLRTVFKI